MSEQMRNLIDKFSDNELQESLLSIRRRLPESMTSQTHQQKRGVEEINESSLSRIYSHIKQHDCAIISAFRDKMINCHKDSYDDLRFKTNKERSRDLRSALLVLGYSVTDVKGSYIENYMEDNAIEVFEDSYFVVNTNDNPKFDGDLMMLGILFCQDSVLFIKDGGNLSYLRGTNNAKYPGFKQVDIKDRIVFGKESEYMTRVGNRPFVIEDFKSLQINSKGFVTKYGRPIVSLMEQMGEY